MSFYSPFAQAYITEMIMETCRATGCVCDRWMDNDIYESYAKFDKENGTNTADEYLNNCHYPSFTVKPPYKDQKEWKCELKCNGPLIKFERCEYTNKEAELILQKQWMDYYDGNLREDDIHERTSGEGMERSAGSSEKDSDANP